MTPDIEVKEQEESEVVERINITLTNVPKKLHRGWKAMAALQGMSMKEALLEALREWVHSKASSMNVQGAPK